MNNYVIYHCHSDLSNGVTNVDSVNKYYDFVEKAKECGMKAFAFAEHGSVFEWVHKKVSIEKAGMKYIHAQEFYVSNMTSPSGNRIRDNYHVVLIAKNYDGVQELNTLSSLGFNDDHKYYEPRISFAELYNTSDNILITSACLGGVLNKYPERYKNVVEVVDDSSMFTYGADIDKNFLEFLTKNKHRCFLEIQHHNCESQIKYNRYLYTLHQEYGIPLIAGTDTHSLDELSAETRLVYQKGKGVHFDGEDEFDLIFKSYDELVEAYRQQNSLPMDVVLEAIENTNVMADMVEEFELDYSYKYPKLYEDGLDFLKKEIYAGCVEKGIMQKPNFQEYKERINRELKTYIHNGAIDFLLLEDDYKKAVKKKGVKFGPSRGSVSGSVICYLLGITDVDSVKYKLNFERFMNEERVSLADVDSDSPSSDHEIIRDYLYNRENLFCCDIITFNTAQLKGCIKDIGKGLGMSLSETQYVSDQVINDNGKFVCPDEIRQKYPELFKYVDKAVGLIVSVGNHPSACVVAPHDIVPKFSTFRTSTNSHPISQINMKEIDSLNYVKLDILGLDAVALIKETCKLANIPYLVPDDMDFQDMNVWNDIANDTTLIFQFESQFASDYLKKVLRPQVIARIKENNKDLNYLDLMAMANGALRPAGASYRDSLAEGIYHDNGHEALNKFLAHTLGYLVYQEQIINFLHQFCGFSMGLADVVRRGFAKSFWRFNQKWLLKKRAKSVESINQT